METLDALMRRVRACRLCAARLPFPPRPLLWLRPGARLLIVGQAPGAKAHESGLPWNDASGVELRRWMAIDRETFYRAPWIAVAPMGFCYPGRMPRGGDYPPRPECAPTWRPLLHRQLPDLTLTVLIGASAHRWYLGGAATTVLEAVTRFRHFLDQGLFPLPHPSWRTTAWRTRHPWFEAEVIPALRQRVAALGREHNGESGGEISGQKGNDDVGSGADHDAVASGVDAQFAGGDQ